MSNDGISVNERISRWCRDDGRKTDANKNSSRFNSVSMLRLGAELLKNLRGKEKLGLTPVLKH
jgi:hypothetical protein